MTGGEFSHADVRDINEHSVESFRDIKPEKEMSSKELNDAVKDEFTKATQEAKDLNNSFDGNNREKNLDPKHKDCMTSSEERKELADRSNGDWDGEPGNSKFHPEKPEAKDALKKYDQDGIDYSDGEPDFSKVSESTVEIDDMTSVRVHNFNQADEKCAEQWNKEKRDDRNNWTGRDVAEWRKENKYSWHERLDMKTMDLVQRDVHEECKHYGGVAECRRHEAQNGGGFDD